MTGTETIGFIGLGSQGGPMAERIAAGGYRLMLWARRPDALAPFLAKGAVAAGSVADLGAACDHVGVCVVDDAGVAEICEQLLPAMKPGSRLAIHSTILPESCIQLAEACARRGIGFIDAPVSGGGSGAAAGTLTVMCGGSADDFAAAVPVFETFGAMIVHLGDAGAGQRAKIVNNALMAANMGLAHAAMQAASALGLHQAEMARLVSGSSGRSFGFDVYARLPDPTAFAHGAPLLNKDVNLLKTTLPDHQGAEILRQTAMTFLNAALGA